MKKFDVSVIIVDKKGIEIENNQIGEMTITEINDFVELIRNWGLDDYKTLKDAYMTNDCTGFDIVIS